MGEQPMRAIDVMERDWRYRHRERAGESALWPTLEHLARDNHEVRWMLDYYDHTHRSDRATPMALDSMLAILIALLDQRATRFEKLFMDHTLRVPSPMIVNPDGTLGLKVKG